MVGRLPSILMVEGSSPRKTRIHPPRLIVRLVLDRALACVHPVELVLRVEGEADGGAVQLLQ